MTISIYQLKPAFQRLLMPLVQALAAAKVTPNQVTVFTLLLACAYGSFMLAFAHTRWVWFGFAFVQLARMALNAVDGLLAQHTNQRTKLGLVLNETGDQVSDAALILPFALAPIAWSQPWFAALVVSISVLAALTEFIGVLAQAMAGHRSHAGPMGKSDRACAFSVLGLLIGFGAPGWLCVAGLIAIVVLLLLSIWNRARAAMDAGIET